jgi:hypothetical protein
VVAGSLSLAQTMRNRRTRDQVGATVLSSLSYFALAGVAEIGARALAGRTGMNPWAARGAVAAGLLGVGLIGSMGDSTGTNIASGIALGGATALAAGSLGVGMMSAAQRFGGMGTATSAAVLGALAIAGASTLALSTGDRGDPNEGSVRGRLVGGVVGGAVAVGVAGGVALGARAAAPYAMRHPVIASVVGGGAMATVGVYGEMQIKHRFDDNTNQLLPMKFADLMDAKEQQTNERFASGSPASNSTMDNADLPMEAAEYLVMRTKQESISKYWPVGTPTFEPVRAYVPMKDGESLEVRADKAVAEFERLGGFYRHTILLNVATGSGAPVSNAGSIAEIATRGDIASISAQYANKPSPYSIPALDDGVRLNEMILEKLQQKIAAIPGYHPHIVATGYSLGAGVLWKLTDGGDPQRLEELGIDRQILFGVPAVAGDDWQDVAAASSAVRVIGKGRPDDVESDATTTVVANDDDPVGTTGSRLLASPETRDGSVDGSLFMPVATFLEHVLDASATQGEVGVLTNGFGHAYDEEMPATVPQALGMPLATWQVTAIEEKAREIEYQRQHPTQEMIDQAKAMDQ